MADTATQDSEEQRRRTQREFEERQARQKAPDVRLEPAAGIDSHALDLPTEAPCFPIERLRLEGARTEEFRWAQDYLNQYAGRCIGRNGINLIHRRLSAQILERGYVTTRLGIPEQNLSSREFRLLLTAGTIREIRFADPTLWGTWRTAFPARPGDLLNIRDLEQGLEQMKRVPSQDVDMEIVPGKEPGESDVVIKLKRDKPWKITLTLDDSGTRTTGKMQSGINLAYDNLFGINDLFNIGLNSDVMRDGSERGTKGNSVYYSFPWEYWTFTFSGSDSRYRQTVYGSNQTFVSSGESQTLDFKIQRLIHRAQNNKTSVQARIAKRFGKSYISDTEIEVQRQNVTSGELALIHRRYFGKAQLDATLAYRKGLTWFNGQSDVAGQTADNPARQYRLQTLDIGLIVPFAVAGQSMRYIAAFRGQTAQTRLYGSEQISIGGRYTVRGYDGDSPLSADKGWYWRNEVEISIPKTPLSAYVGLDHGEIRGGGTETQPARQLTGTVLGIRGEYKKASLDAFVGWALHKPQTLSTSRPAAGFQFSYQF